jgi:hypothetical protein
MSIFKLDSVNKKLEMAQIARTLALTVGFAAVTASILVNDNLPPLLKVAIPITGLGLLLSTIILSLIIGEYRDLKETE